MCLSFISLINKIKQFFFILNLNPLVKSEHPKIIEINE